MADDFNNKLNEDNNKKNSEYSFWAEQVSSSSYQVEDGSKEQQYDQSPNSYSNGNHYYPYNGYQNDPYNNYNNSNNSNYNVKNGKDSNGFTKFFGFLVKGVAFGLIVAVTFMGFNKVVSNIDPNSDGNGGLYLNSGDNKYTIEQTNITSGKIEETDVTKVVEETMPSIVTLTGIFTETYNFFGQSIDEEKEGGGSGIIMGENEKELLIATNNHVVEGAKPIVVTFIDGTEAEAIIKGTDSAADLAVISVDLSTISKETKDAIKIAKINTDEDIKVGEKAVAIGNALGYGQSVTVGYISAKDREVNVSNNKMVLLQTDAAINPGNSGGALLNMKGEVIGINTVKFAASEVEGMGYAIPVSKAMPIINELMSREMLAEDEQGYLGIGINDVTEDIAAMFNWPVGVYVAQVAKGSGAEKAGILTGDIITELNDIKITSSTQLIEKVTSYRVGTQVTISVMRNENGSYVEKEFQVTLSEKPNL